ncbi:MAG: cytochrome C [Caldilinea sp. CFX5]|nr:cytochrome C [Caldilinea sp. CFX5]
MNAKRLFASALLLGALLLLVTAAAEPATADPMLTPNEQLGESIFDDPNLSIEQNQSCAACHAAEVGGTGPDSAINAAGSVYEGSISGRFGDRKPPSSAYATQSPILHFVLQKGEAVFIGGNFWDGRATGEKLGNPAADQAQGPFLNHVEQALPDSACVVYRVCNPVDPNAYPVKFEDVWGADACLIDWPADVEQVCAQEGTTVALSLDDRGTSDTAYDRIALSIAAYEASPKVNAFTAKFDAFMARQAKLTKMEKQGLNLFFGKAKCVNCHTLDRSGKTPSLFTDFTYDNLGVPKNRENPVYNSDPNFIDLGLGGFLARRTDYAQYAAANNGKQKVPTLRNVDLRPNPGFVKAYMHNGYFKTLEGVVHFYNTRDILPRCEGDYTEAQALAAKCWPAPEVAANMNTTELGNLGLKPQEEAELVAFMKTLSDGYAGVSSIDTEEGFTIDDVLQELAAESAAPAHRLFLPVVVAATK